MSERTQRNLRGPLKSCSEENTVSGRTDGEGKTYPEVHPEYTTEFDVAGRLLATRRRNSDGSQWVMRYGYDPSGRLLKTASGVEGQASTETNYSYDEQGRLQKISGRTDNPITFGYDEHGRKSKIEISSPADYRPGIAQGDPRLRLRTGRRTCQVEEARPPFTTNMTEPRKCKCVTPAASW